MLLLVVWNVPPLAALSCQRWDIPFWFVFDCICWGFGLVPLLKASWWYVWLLVVSFCCAWPAPKFLFLGLVQLLAAAWGYAWVSVAVGCVPLLEAAWPCWCCPTFGSSAPPTFSFFFVSLFLSLSLSLFSLFLSFSLSLSFFSVSLFLCVCVCVCVSVFLSLSLCVCVFLSAVFDVCAPVF